MEAVKEKQTIDLAIKLETWEAEREYDRLGLEEEYTEILGTKIVCHSIPIRPGRNPGGDLRGGRYQSQTEKKWVIMRRRSCISGCRRAWSEAPRSDN